MQKHILRQSPDANGLQDEPALPFLLSSQGFATGYVSTASLIIIIFFLAGQKGPKAGEQEAGVLFPASKYREGWAGSSSG